MSKACGGVLLVDDDADVCEAYAEVLTESGHRVACAHNGREALDHLRATASKPCVVLIDLMMPVMDGRELHAELRRDPTFEAPIVLMTADRRSWSIDADAYLRKPASLDALLEVVNRFCACTPGR